MELKDFVRETLKGIIDGVSEAQPYALSKGACINPDKIGTARAGAIMRVGNDSITYVQKVDFSLSVRQSRAADGKIGIEVLDALKIGGSYERLMENKVSFCVPMALPRSETR